jgi:hypothetical protein
MTEKKKGEALDLTEPSSASKPSLSGSKEKPTLTKDQIEAEQKKAEENRQALLQQKASAAGAEVEKAKLVAKTKRLSGGSKEELKLNKK